MTATGKHSPAGKKLETTDTSQNPTPGIFEAFFMKTNML